MPNEHGTWYFGRNGWCDGLDVTPLVFDITDVVNSGEVNELQCFARSYDVGGGRERDEGCGGYILMSS